MLHIHRNSPALFHKTDEKTTISIATLTSSVMTRINQILKLSTNKHGNDLYNIEIECLIDFLTKYPEMWVDFHNELAVWNVTTNVGVVEVLHKYLSMKKEYITSRYKIASEQNERHDINDRTKDCKRNDPSSTVFQWLRSQSKVLPDLMNVRRTGTKHQQKVNMIFPERFNKPTKYHQCAGKGIFGTNLQVQASSYNESACYSELTPKILIVN